MTGYNQAHGDTEAVRLDLCNDQQLYAGYTRCVEIANWDGPASRWVDVDAAQAALRDFVQAVQAGPREPVAAEIKDADLAAVDFMDLIRRELTQRNLDAGREGGAGLGSVLC